LPTVAMDVVPAMIPARPPVLSAAINYPPRTFVTHREFHFKRCARI
jgi:hypothetical protein